MGSITLSGTGVAKADPDIARISISIRNFNASSKESRNGYNVLANRIIDGCRNEPFQISEKDIQHAAPQVYPEQREKKNKYVIVGYHCQGVINVKLRNLDDVDAFVDACSELGDQIAVGSVSFDVENKAALFNEARKAAVQDVKSKASLYCEEAGLALGGLISLSENQTYGDRRATNFALAKTASASRDESTQTIASETEVSISIQVEWGIGAQLRGQE